jgi:hypothetical protein
MVAPFYFLWTTKAIAKGRYGYRCCYEIVAQALASSGPMTLCDHIHMAHLGYYETQSLYLWLCQNHPSRNHKKLLKNSDQCQDSLQFWIYIRIS